VLCTNDLRQDNARTLAAKERVEKLKHGTSKGLPSSSISPISKSRTTPLANKSKSLNQSPPTPTKKISPVKDWKNREKIIQDAVETIKSFPVDKSNPTSFRKERQQIGKNKNVHSLLSTSPFHRSTVGDSSTVVKPKRREAQHDTTAEPAMITRRTIERDFYQMSKKRNTPSKQRQRLAKETEPTPELKTSVLRKKYRCDERIMKVKKKRAERQYEKLKHLRLPTDEEASGEEQDELSSSSDEEEEEYRHALHDLLERHISAENARSLKRSNKELMKTTFKLDVKDFWNHLQKDNPDSAACSEHYNQVLCRNGQVQSVPLHIATKKFDEDVPVIGDCVVEDSIVIEERGPISRYICPYTKPTKVKLQLVSNEQLPSTSLTVSISMICDNEEDDAANNMWMYEVYNPCNGSMRTFTLSDSEFDSFNKKLPSVSTSSPSVLSTAAAKAHNSLLNLRAKLSQLSSDSEDGGVEQVFDMAQQQQIEIPPSITPPLSMRITGSSPYSNTICPGHVAIGKRGIWRLTEPLVDDNPDPSFPIWPSATDIKYPDSLDISQATASFQYKSLGSQKGNCITVLNSLAFESPVLAPDCIAVDKGYISPPFAEHELVDGTIPHIHIPCTSLMNNPLKSRFDTLLPPPIVVLDSAATYEDWKDAPRNADGQVYHCREVNEYNQDGFRVKTYANVVEYDSTISSTVYGISESAASPNRPAITDVLTHRATEPCTEYLSRVRTAADYHYIAESDGEGTLNEPYLFATHMSAYNSVFVSRKSISSYREEERFTQAAKEAEQKRLDLALKMKAAEEIVEERLKARIARIEKSVKDEYEGDIDDVVSEGSIAIPDSMVDGNSSLVNQVAKIPCDVELPTTSIVKEDGEEETLEQLANLLLKNTSFLKAVARKLSISEEQLLNIDANTEEDEVDIKDQATKSTALLESTQLSTPSPSPPSPPQPPEPKQNIPKLKLNCKRYRDETHTSTRGDGWKRLPRSETIIGDFSLTKRNVQRGTGQSHFKKLQERHFTVNAVKELKYQPDPQQFETKPKSIFIPDLTTERLRLAKTYRQQKKAIESMLTKSQQQSLDEILQIPVSKPSEKRIDEENDQALIVDNNKRDVNVLADIEEVRRPIDNVARAVLAVKNHNITELEKVLDTEGLSVETRDQHGNTLLILACQQGSKKLAKFMLRRGANINAQNNGGNTSLHYLYEYKHVTLAEYLLRKGANDGIKNSNGLTVYEGVCLDGE